MGRLINANDVKKLLVARYENAELITKEILYQKKKYIIYCYILLKLLSEVE